MSSFALDSKNNKNLFRWLIRTLIYFSLFSMFFIPIWLDPVDRYNVGNLFGVMAAIVFIITDIPGILRRFKLGGIFKQIQRLLMYSRAHLGVLMFLFATTHYLAVFLFPLTESGELRPFLAFEIFGVIALYGLFPLFLTSNQWSKKKLKKWWGRLHRLTYILIWAVFLHVALVGGVIIAFAILITGALQIMSLLYEYLEKRAKQNTKSTSKPAS